MELTKKQRDFIDLDCRFQAFIGGRGSGKTFVGASKVCTKIKPGEIWSVVAVDEVTAEGIVIPTIRHVLEDIGIEYDVTGNPVRNITIENDSGVSKIKILHADNADRLRGVNVDGIWFDDASLIDKNVFQCAIPTLRKKGIFGTFLMTFNWMGFENWTSKVLFDEIDSSGYSETDSVLTSGFAIETKKSYKVRENSAVVLAPSLSNSYLPREFFESLSKTVDPKWIKAETQIELV